MTTNEPPPYPGDQPESNPSTSGLPSYGSVPPPQDGSYPPPPPPPGAPGGFEEPFSAPGAIAWGWRAFTANVGPILLAVVILAIVYVGFTVLDIVARGGLDSQQQDSGSLALSLLFNLLSAVASFFIGGAFIRATLDVADGKPFDLFGAFSRVPYGLLFLAALLTFAATVLGLVALCVGAIVVAFLAYFTQYYVIDDRLGPWTAFTSSFRLVSSNVGDSLLLALLNILIIIGGALLCGLGLFVAYPVVFLATAYAFRRFQGKPVASY